MIQSFLIVAKDTQGNDKMPNRRITTKIEDSFLDLGVGWVKKNDKGETFLSCKLQEQRVHEGKTYPGYVILSEGEYARLKAEIARLEPYAVGCISPDSNNPQGIDMVNHPLNSNYKDNTPTLEEIGF